MLMTMSATAEHAKEVEMNKTFKTLAVVAALGAASLVAIAQPMGGHDGMMGQQGRHGKMDSTKMEAMAAKRADALKAQLKLTAEQQPAWNAFLAAMKPDTTAKPQHPSREELDKLTTPERIDKMRALHDQQHKDMQAAMDKRDQATKTFYNSLNAEQKKVFDSQHMRMGEHQRGKHGKGEPKKAPAKP
jgi:hypothetical protein